MPATGPTTFELGAGDATLDLSRLDDTTARPRLSGQRARWVPASCTILVPNGLDTRVDASVGIGDITHRGGVGGTTESTGRDRSTSTVIGDQPVEVIVDAELGLGQITIQEQ